MKFSIVTATFNSQNTVADALASVKKQTYKNFEHIIIDGASNDETLSILEKHKYDKLKIFSEKDNGIYDALNKGIEKASGDVIAFLHADDIYANNFCLEKIAKLFNEKNADAIYADLQYVSENDTSRIVRNWKSGEFLPQNIKRGWMPPHPTFFVRSHLYQKFGNFNTSYKIAADYDLMMRFLSKYKITVAYLPEVTIKMRIGGASNKNIKNILVKMKEDLQAMKGNDIGGVFTLFMKNYTKISQFFNK